MNRRDFLRAVSIAAPVAAIAPMAFAQIRPAKTKNPVEAFYDLVKEQEPDLKLDQSEMQRHIEWANSPSYSVGDKILYSGRPYPTSDPTLYPGEVVVITGGGPA